MNNPGFPKRLVQPLLVGTLLLTFAGCAERPCPHEEPARSACEAKALRERVETEKKRKVTAEGLGKATLKSAGKSLVRCAVRLSFRCVAHVPLKAIVSTAVESVTQ